jgi:NADPH:quinone reductase-like Zn-dependent oxidoreductase
MLAQGEDIMTPPTRSLARSENPLVTGPGVYPSPRVTILDTMKAAMKRQQVVVLKQFGGPEGLTLTDCPMPTAGPGEVRVRVLAASVQFTDLMVRRGRYPGLEAKPPLVLGYDVVGEIDAVGTGVMGFEIGDRVADLTVTGSYARYRTLRADRVVRVPAGVESAQAATLVLSWVTAYQLLHRHARVAEGQRVLIHGAAGAVGQALLALGRLAGVRMWGSARASDAELVRSFGATPIDFEAQDNAVFGRGDFDSVFDGVGEEGFVRSWASVKRGGMLSAYGLSAAVKADAHLLTMGWWLARLRLWDLWPNGKTARWYSISAVRKKHPDWYRADLEELFRLLASGAIRPLVAERIGLDDVADAHRRLEAGRVGGKIVICP